MARWRSVMARWREAWGRRRSKPVLPAPAPAQDLELEKLAARIAHDVLSPLQAVSYAFDLMSRTRDPEKLKRCEESGRASLKRVQTVVEGLFEFARAQAPPVSGSSAPVQAAISDVLNEFKGPAQEEGVELRLGEIAPCVVAAEPRVLGVVLGHLIRNALQYMGDGGERWVELRVRPELGRVVLEVEDTAGGIPPELRGTLFEPHVRSQRNKKTGLGLGLPTVKRVVEAHGGSVHVASVAGRGTVFTLEWPHAQAERSAEAERPPYLT